MYIYIVYICTHIMKPLTLKQKTVLDFIKQYCNERGFPPTLREIGEGTGLLNISAVCGHISAIQKKGYIQREVDKARSIRVLTAPSAFSRLKRQLHEFAGTDEGVLQHVVYGVVMATRKKRPHFAGSHKDWINDTLEKKAAEHGWVFLQKQIKPDHIILAVKVWPNHSPQSVVSRIKQAGDSARLLHLREFPGKSLWAKQYAVTTEPDNLEDIATMLLESVSAESDK
jgi:REP element-mobilizing transposase RayT